MGKTVEIKRLICPSCGADVEFPPSNRTKCEYCGASLILIGDSVIVDSVTVDKKIDNKRKHRSYIPFIIGIIIFILLMRSCSSSGDPVVDEKGDDTVQVEYTEISVDPIEEKRMVIDPPEEKNLVIDPARIEIHKGNMKKEEQDDYYQFRASEQGLYRLEINGLENGGMVGLYIYDSKRNEMGWNGYCHNGDGLTLEELKKDQIYEVHVIQNGSFTPYELSICYPKAKTDVSEYSQVNDSIQYADQNNKYLFTPAYDGTYRFGITDMKAGVKVSMILLNSLGEEIQWDGYIANNDGILVPDLKQGEKYTLQVNQSQDKGNYTLNIGKQKKTVDITGYTAVEDSLGYVSQENKYSFTPEYEGVYRFQMADIRDEKSVDLTLYNSLGEELDTEYYCHNGDGLALRDLNPGEEYLLVVAFRDSIGNYTLLQGQQKAPLDAGRNYKISDSIQFAYQENVYTFTSSEKGPVYLTASDMPEGTSLGIEVYNHLGERVEWNSFCGNGDGLSFSYEGDGEVMTIKVLQSRNAGAYTLTIN